VSARPAAGQFFDAIARSYDRSYAPSGLETRRGMARVLRELPRQARLLVLGVGTGRELPALLDAGHSPVGLDASSEMLARCATRRRPVPLVLGDLWAPLPWGDGAFDGVLALHGTLCHPPRDDAWRGLASELARVLRAGGVFVAEMPTVAWLAHQAEGELGRLEPGAEGRARYVDFATEATVEISCLTEEGYRRALGGGLSVRIDEARPGEVLVVARKAAIDEVTFTRGA
jgi:SAM-dependent methyltransferase